MSGWGVAFVVACFVAIVVVVARVVGPASYVVPPDVRPVRTVTPMSPEEIWGK